MKNEPLTDHVSAAIEISASDDQLPKEWCTVELRELGEIVTGKTPSTKEKDNFGGDIPFIKPGDLDRGGYVTSTSEQLSEKGLSTVPRLSANSIVVTCIGNLGKVGITSKVSATNQQINSIIPYARLEHKYLYYFLLTLKPWLEQNASATTVAIINKGKFSKAPVAVPPLAEQKIIAAKLDELLAQVDTLKTRLDTIPKILKRFRQSVLAAAVSGRLTEGWREKNKPEDIVTTLEKVELGRQGKLKVKIRSGWDSSIKLFDLPDGWSWIANHRLAHDSTNAICAGPFGTIFKAKDFRLEGVPIIFLRHVKEGGFNQKKPTYMDLTIWKSQHQEYSVYGGELLVTKLGDPPGESCIYPKNSGVAMVTPDVLKMNVDESVAHTKYIMHFFNSPISKKMVGDSAFGATRLRIDIAMFKGFPIPTPPREEQAEIVRRVEQLFAYADQIEQQVKNAQARVNHLTQSILAKAFRGELTADWRAQNPELVSGENSAQALLERIKAEREAGGVVKKVRKGRK